jgi:hypothetical protein
MEETVKKRFAISTSLFAALAAAAGGLGGFGFDGRPRSQNGNCG